MKPMPNPDDVRRHLKMMIQDGIHEVRFLASDNRPPVHQLIQSKDIDKAVKKICEFNAKGYNCYITLNPLNEAIKQSATAASDGYVQRRQWLYVDIDANKAVKANVMATNAEHDDAIRRAGVLAERLPFPAPVKIDSGNGVGLLYRVDLPNDEETTQLFKSCLAALQKLEAQVDVKVFNAARIARIVGTVNIKGQWVEQDVYDDPSQWRPWRLARYLSVPESMVPVSKEDIEKVAGPSSTPPKAREARRNTDPGRSRVSSDEFAKKLFWAMYFERFGEGVSPL